MNKPIWKNKKIRVGVLLLLALLYFSHATANPNPYASYDTYNKNNKRIGVLKHYKQEKTGRYYLSLYYPEFKDKHLTEIVNTYKFDNMNLDTHSQNGMMFISIDYAADRILERYIRLHFQKVSTYRKKNDVQKKSTYFTYDEKTHRLVVLDDFLQGDYKKILQIAASQQQVSQQDFEALDLQDFKIEVDGIYFYKNEHVIFQLPKKGYESYFRKDAYSTKL